MGWDAVKDKVLATARAEADGIVGAARAEVERLKAERDAEDDQALAAALREVERQAEQIRAQTLGTARRENRMALLAAKNVVLHDIFAEVRARFLALSATEQIDSVLGWLADDAPEVGGVLRVAPERVEAFAARLEEIDRGRTETARIDGVEADADLVAGARISGPLASADVTLDRRLHLLRERYAAAAAEILFGDGGEDQA